MIFRSPFPDVTIPEIPYHSFILQQAPLIKDKPVFFDGTSGRVLTFSQVESGALAVAFSLAEKGFKKGDVFAILSPNLPGYAIAFHGVIMTGGVVTTGNPLYTAEELIFQLNDTGAKYLLTVPAFMEKSIEAAEKSQIEEIFVFGEAESATPFVSLLQNEGKPPEVQITPREDLAVLPYSSGTSGRPKGVMLTHYNLVAVTRQVENLARYDENSRTLGVLPFYHIYGMVALMNYPLYRGGTCVTMSRFDLEQLLKIVQDYRLTHLYLVPPIVLALAKHPLVDKYDLGVAG